MIDEMHSCRRTDELYGWDHSNKLGKLALVG